MIVGIMIEGLVEVMNGIHLSLISVLKKDLTVANTIVPITVLATQVMTE